MAMCLLCYCRRSTAVSNAYGGRRTIRMTVVNSADDRHTHRSTTVSNAADGRRTMTKPS